MAWHPTHRILLIVEVKSRIGNVQETLLRLDTKVRLGGTIAADLGYGRPASVVRALALVDESTNRRVVARHPALFEVFAVRGRSTRRWLRSPIGQAQGLLWFHMLSDSDGSRTTDAERARVRRPAGPQPHVTDPEAGRADSAAVG